MAKQTAEQKARDELARTPPRAFISTRNRLAAELKRAGEDKAASAIRKLRRPSPSVWAVNALSDRAKDVVTALLEAGAAVRLAQRKALSGAGGQDLRGATSTLHDEVGSAASTARKLLTEAGENASNAVMERVRSSLLAAAISDEDVRQALREGRLEEDLSPAGFGMVTPLRVGSAQAKPPPEPEEKKPTGPSHAELLRHRDLAKSELARQRKAAQVAERESARLAKLAESMEQRAREARAHADAARKQARDAAAAMSRAEEKLKSAEEALHA